MHNPSGVYGHRKHYEGNRIHDRGQVYLYVFHHKLANLVPQVKTRIAAFRYMSGTTTRNKTYPRAYHRGQQGETSDPCPSAGSGTRTCADTPRPATPPRRLPAKRLSRTVSSTTKSVCLVQDKGQASKCCQKEHDAHQKPLEFRLSTR